MLAESGVPDAKFLRKIREKNAFWNILMFVIFSRNEWAKKNSQPCLPVERLEDKWCYSRKGDRIRLDIYQILGFLDTGSCTVWNFHVCTANCQRSLKLHMCK